MNGRRQWRGGRGWGDKEPAARYNKNEKLEGNFVIKTNVAFNE